MKPLDGVVLAGGSSRRLGQDKALLRFGDTPLLAACAATVFLAYSLHRGSIGRW